MGFTLFARNIENATQLMALNKELKALAKQAGYDIILAVDQEGGKVERLPSPFSKVKPMRTWGDIFAKTGRVEPLYELGKILGSEVRAAGFNLDFAPVVDVDLHSANPVIGNRSFSPHPEVVYKLARQVIRGLLHEGVIPCLKHFPGHGATTKDSHVELPLDDRLAEKVFKYDITPFKKLIDDNLAPTIMTAHVVYPELDRKNPATLSEKILKEILREKLNYNGMVFSDDLLMKAIFDHHDLFAASQRFFHCGGDVVLICKHPEMTLELIQKFAKETPKNLQLKPAKKRIQKLRKSLHASLPEENLSGLLAKNQAVLQQFFL